MWRIALQYKMDSLKNTDVQIENLKIIHCTKIFLLACLFKYPMFCTSYIALFLFSGIQF